MSDAENTEAAVPGDDFNIDASIIKSGGMFQVHFAVTGTAPERPGRMSVSRRPDHAFYALQDIPKHNGNGPSFQFKEGAHALIARVFEDIDRVLEGENPETDDALVNRGEVWPKVGAPEGVTIGDQTEEVVKVEKESAEATEVPDAFASALGDISLDTEEATSEATIDNEEEDGDEDEAVPA